MPGFTHSKDMIEVPEIIKMGYTTLTTCIRGFCCLQVTLDIAYQYTKFDDSSFSHYRDIIGAPRNFNESHDVTTPFWG